MLIHDVRERTAWRMGTGVAANMRELGMVDAQGDRGLAEAPIADGGIRGLGAWRWRKGTVGWLRRL
jgi:hypothetical protein